MQPKEPSVLKNKKTIPIFVPHKGCPNDCIFCNQKKITGIQKEQTNEDVVIAIETALQTIQRQDTHIEIAFFGGSFTAIEVSKQEEFLAIANRYIAKGQVDSIRISTRPDAIDQEILNRLKKYRVKVIELGVQSMDEDVLLLSNRGHDSNCVAKSAALIQKNSFFLGLQMMIGLPLDTKSKVEMTVDKFIQIKPDCVRIYPVLVIKDTALEHMYHSGLYQALDIMTAAELAKDAYVKFEESNIKVIRLGLQASDTINLEADVVAGPFHPAFGEIVQSLVYRDKIEKYLQETNKTIEKEIIVETANRNISKVIGNNKINKSYFEEQYKLLLSTKAIKDKEFPQDILVINGEKISLNQGVK